MDERSKNMSYPIIKPYDLQNTFIFRRGHASDGPPTHVKEISILKVWGNMLDIEFSIPAAGGGFTNIALQVLSGDFPKIQEGMEEILRYEQEELNETSDT